MRREGYRISLKNAVCRDDSFPAQLTPRRVHATNATMTPQQIQTIQDYLQQNNLDAWLVYDFRGGNPVFSQLLGGKKWTTRRVALLIPSHGEPLLAVHRIDAPQFDALNAQKTVFLSWPQWQQWVREQVSPRRRIAMEWSHHGDLPAASFVDGGVIDLVRSVGCEVVSSADLVQLCTARWSPESLEAHRRAAKLVNQIKDEAFALIRGRLAEKKKVTEYGVQSFILRRFADEKLDPDHPPIAGRNENSADPHFEVDAQRPKEIRRGDWVLIDLWARWPGEEHIFSDITWVAFAGEQVPGEHHRIFNTVKAARDAALQRCVDAWNNQSPVMGCDVDDAAMNVFRQAGEEPHIIHRTGHSLSPGAKIHGLGVNIDNFETHDTRLLLPRLGFTIEPALYLPGKFGCRSEINVYIDEHSGPVLTSEIQGDVILV